MVAMPETHEQWSSWGDTMVQPQSITRIGLNFGAPGDRMTRDGTLWLDYPAIGGPSPRIRVETKPKNPTFRYRHSNWVEGGGGWPWAVASAMEGLDELTLYDLRPGTYTVRLYFAELSDKEADARVQTVSLQGRAVLQDFNIQTEAGGSMKGVVKELTNISVDGKLTLQLRPSKPDQKTLIGGLELIRIP